jgi:hypothetical protein
MASSWQLMEKPGFFLSEQAERSFAISWGAASHLASQDTWLLKYYTRNSPQFKRG